MGSRRAQRCPQAHDLPRDGGRRRPAAAQQDAHPAERRLGPPAAHRRARALQQGRWRPRYLLDAGRGRRRRERAEPGLGREGA
ncbi:MAG: hypothetical protein MUC84_10310, partial [Solirubrobacteraceae bacterium]|nr:hypothetical protein [Solirubrobacteraceae bacterium]